MRIIVDADACPGKNIIEDVAKSYRLEVIMFCDINHILNSNYSSIKYVDSGFQSVDMYVVNEAKKEDIVITQDYGVATIVLGKGSNAISPKGKIYSNDNIDRMLFERHMHSKLRKSGVKVSNSKKRTHDDDERLRNNLIKIIENNLNRG